MTASAAYVGLRVNALDCDASAMDVLRLRKNSKLTQEEFWGRVEITQSGGSRYEHGRNIPEPVRILLTLAYGSPNQREAALKALQAPTTRRGPKVSPRLVSNG